MTGPRVRMGWGALGLLLAACAALPGGAARAGTVTQPVMPGQLGPANPTATQPPEIQANPPINGVITPPEDISRMPVIKPKVPSRMPVIPPGGGTQPPGAVKVVPK